MQVHEPQQRFPHAPVRTPLSFERFTYSQLPSQSCIRVLSFVRPQDQIGAVSFDGYPLIECTLECVDLNHSPTFTALSYTWGNWERKDRQHYDGYAKSVKWPILVNGKIHYITRNLHDALSQFGPRGQWDGRHRLVDRRDQGFNKTKLIRAAELGDLPQVEDLLQRGAGIGLQDQFGETALHYAAENGHLPIVKTLLEYGADQTILDSTNRTPLDCCLQTQGDRWQRIAEVLRSHPADAFVAPVDTRAVSPLNTKIWADAICINQTDVQERSAQVAAMSSIYSSAKRVLVWLGVPDEKTDFVWRTLDSGLDEEMRDFRRDFRAEFQAKGGVFGNVLSSTIDLFLQRYWFSRRWVIQELALAREIEMFCGSYQFSWELLSMYILQRTRLTSNVPTLGTLTYTDLPKYAWTSTRLAGPWALANIRFRTNANLGNGLPGLHPPKSVEGGETEVWKSKLSLSILIILTWHFDAIDPRDRIYALLGIAQLPENVPAIYPDYSKSLGHVYTDAARIFVEAKGFNKFHNYLTGDEEDFEPLEGLSFVQGSLCGKHLFDPFGASCKEAVHRLCDLPSWVPDFGGRLGTSRINATRFNAATKLQSVIYPSPRHVLSLEACVVDRVVEAENKPVNMCGWSIRSIEFYDSMSWLKLISRLDIFGPSGHNRAETLWRTLVTDSIEDDSLNLKLNFRRFLCEEIAVHKPSFWDRRRKMRLIQMLSDTDDSDSLPTPAEVDRFCKVYEPDQTRSTRWQSNSRSFEYGLAKYTRGRGLFRTQAGYLGLGPRWIHNGDVVCLIAGARTPFVLRELYDDKKRPHYRFLGEAYVHGIMHGEAFERQSLNFGPIEIH